METTFSKFSNTGRNYIAFFDLDGTISSSNSGKTLFWHAYNQGLTTKMDLINGIYLSLLYRLNLKDPAKIIDKMVSWLNGLSEDKLDELSTDIFDNSISKSIYPGVYPEIIFHKKNGASVVILSSAILPVCQKVADYLQLDDILCSEPEVKNGYLTGRSKGPLCFGEEKKSRLTYYCEKNNTKTEDAWYYGDSISDLAALSAAGNPVCVNPDKKLKKEAEKRGWRVLLWQ